jgi:hypothetical protein
MRGLLLLALLAGRGMPRGPTAAPALATAEYFVEGRITGDPVTDHTVTLQVNVRAQPGHHLGAPPYFDIGGGCCFEKTHWEEPRLERCTRDASKSCGATFEVPWRVSGYGNAGGTVTFTICDADGCALRAVAVAVPYQTHP